MGDRSAQRGSVVVPLHIGHGGVGCDLCHVTVPFLGAPNISEYSLCSLELQHLILGCTVGLDLEDTQTVQVLGVPDKVH